MSVPTKRVGTPPSTPRVTALTGSSGKAPPMSSQWAPPSVVLTT